ncbi:hypothetical protein DEU56DRAFT_734508 [Suillus clintonianus]|uniref:uncharacterized protein n=1 Tax=Suillus clintonianus TaxID=1904413 RepID=UPI001B86F83C|nr:uncharacterized protein DEU56DRAFT_734508 [Suillus clintonianus]KAG2141277.1 hypothetical protein DEU56DRAFT_734508 [Suillus clintonianus]
MASTFDALSHLSEYEIWWRSHYNFLEEKGYKLRSRYSPDWVPSWTNTNKADIDCEDGIVPRHSLVLDARRIQDGARVSLKRIDVSRHPCEIEIGRYFSTSPLSKDPANHCVPIYDVLQVPADDHTVIIIMPLLADFTDPYFDTVGEVVDCIHQLFEGLRFMHSHHVAHRDCMDLNILMDGSIFIDPWHAFDQYMSEDYKRVARHRARTKSPPRYYYIDFGISRKYEASNTNPLEEPIFGGDKEVPEFNEDNYKPRNPFPTDVWYLGHAIQEIFLDVKCNSACSFQTLINIKQHYSGVEFLSGLVSDMMHSDPAQRPNMEEIFSRFQVLRQGFSSCKLRSRVAHDKERSVFDFLAHWARRIQYIVRRIPATHTSLSTWDLINTVKQSSIIPPADCCRSSRKCFTAIQTAKHSARTSQTAPKNGHQGPTLSLSQINIVLLTWNCAHPDQFDLQTKLSEMAAPVIASIYLLSEHIPPPSSCMRSRDDIRSSPTTTQAVMASTSDALSHLSEYEIWWRSHYNFLEEKGYKLRSRYSPDWVPSWTNTNKADIDCEDRIGSPHYLVLDARRIQDGARVSLKRIDVSRHPYEIEIGRYFSTSPLIKDPANRCVPIYDVLQVPADDHIVIIVMPLLRDFTDPYFDTVGEVVDCIHQLFEGLRFMHSHHVAHRDCMQLNILMDDSIFIDAWHGSNQFMSEDLKRAARHRARTKYPPLYYYIDFGISRKYEASNTNPLEEPIFGGDKEVPEFNEDNYKARNPFPTDVWYLGHVIQETFLDVKCNSACSFQTLIYIKQHHSGVEFLSGLVSDMMHSDPAQRPNMDEIFSQFQVLRQGFSSCKLRSRVAHDDERSVFDFLAHWARRIVHSTQDSRSTYLAVIEQSSL